MEDVQRVQVAHGAGNLSPCCSAAPPNQPYQRLAIAATKAKSMLASCALHFLTQTYAGGQACCSDSTEEGAVKAQRVQ